MLGPDHNNNGDEEVLEFVSQIAEEGSRRIEERLPHRYVRLKVSEAERRQALYDIRTVEDVVRELVRNSRDAGAGKVLVGTQKRSNRYRDLSVIDDGCGVPEELHSLIFEPRVTSRLDDIMSDQYGIHGRGMALFSIKSRVMSVDVAYSEPGWGTVMDLEIDTSMVRERTDQSSRTPLVVSGDRVALGRGPHNLFRVLLEMTMSAPTLEIYLGSFAEVLSTLRSMGGRNDAPWSGISEIKDAGELVDYSSNRLAMPVSERTAYRILAGEVEPLTNVFNSAPRGHHGGAFAPGARVGKKIPGTAATSKVRPWMSEKNLSKRIAKADIEEIARVTKEAVDDIGGKYFLRSIGVPRVRRGRQRIAFTVYLEELDDE